MKLLKKHMLRTVSKFIKPFALVALFFCVSTAGAQTKVIDQIVAQVGDEIILLSDIQNARLEMIQGNQTLTGYTDCDILEELMFEKLLITQAEIDSVEISDDM